MYRQAGFNLIELMLVMTIVAILIVVAYPAYQNHGTKTRRIDAQSALLELATQMEKVYGRTQDYSQASIGVVDEKLVISSTNLSPAGHYKLSLKATATSYELSAQPLADGAQAADLQCQLMRINQTGYRSAYSQSDGSGQETTNTCWQ